MREYWRGMSPYLKFATLVLVIVSTFALVAPERGAALAMQIGDLARTVGESFASWVASIAGGAR